MTEYESRLDERSVSGWAVGGMIFAATILIMVGIFEMIAGLAAIFEDEFFVATPNYLFDLDVTAWGWIHLILGVLLACTGWALLQRKAWAAMTAVFLAVLAAVNNFFFIPYYPWWSLLLIALCCWLIWALTRPGMTDTL
jgi:hypothetical protein